MATRWKTNSEKRKGSALGICIILFFAVLAGTAMLCSYPHLRKKAEEGMEKQKEQMQQEENELSVIEDDLKFYLLNSIYYMNYEISSNVSMEEYMTKNYDISKLTKKEAKLIGSASQHFIKALRQRHTLDETENNYFSYAAGEKEFGHNSDLMLMAKGKDREGVSVDNFQSGIVIHFDKNGIPSISDSWNLGFDDQMILDMLNQTSMGQLVENLNLEDFESEDSVDEAAEESAEIDYQTERELLSQLPLPEIRNVTFAFGFQNLTPVSDDYRYDYSYYIEGPNYLYNGYLIGLASIWFGMMVLALILQNIKPLHLRENPIFGLPTEIVAGAAIFGLMLTMYVMAGEFAYVSLGSGLKEGLMELGVGNRYVSAAANTIIWLVWVLFGLCWYWFAASVLPYITHPIRMLKEKMLFVKLCRWITKKCGNIYDWATDIQLEENLNKTIWKIVGLNGVLVAFLCCFWFGGALGAIIYSLLLYFLIKKKCGKVQDDFKKLLAKTRRLAKGDLTGSAKEDMGLFNPVRDELESVQEGFKRAVESEVRSRNMKTELITNVSHDLKTPLTAIITYVDLLKQDNLTEEQRKSYVETLDKKSQRLKVLIEDLFEVSKAATNNVTMNFTEVDLVNLIKQVRLENEDKIAASTLDIRWNLLEDKCVLTLDPNRTYRIMDNLLQNILKYAMEHSRVYIDMEKTKKKILVCFKNISAAEMNFSPDEIAERFVRGDLSRNSEGSGLGLAIAQSFTELQNGTFKVEIDGDLFKVTLSWDVEEKAEEDLMEVKME